MRTVLIFFGACLAFSSVILAEACAWCMRCFLLIFGTVGVCFCTVPFTFAYDDSRGRAARAASFSVKGRLSYGC